MVTREDLVGKTQQEIEKLLEAEIQAFNVEVSELSDEATVLDKEQELINAMNEYDEYLKAVEYDVAESCTFDNQTYNKKTASDYIVDFVNTQEVDWNYTRGLYELVKLWRNKDLTKIQHHAYDTTLRILGQCKFKGFEAWKKIMIVNTFLSASHEEYVRDTSYMIYLSSLHNILLDALKQFNPEVMGEAEPEIEGTESQQIVRE